MPAERGGATLARLIASRCAALLVVVFGAATIVFFVTHTMGDPAAIMLPEGSTPAQIEQFRQRLGLDDPLWQQLARFYGQTLRGDLGESFWQRVPVLGLVLERIPASLLLGLGALVVSVLAGVPLGIAAAMTARPLVDRAIFLFSLGLLSVANFWAGILLIRWLAVERQLLPTSGYAPDVRHLVLPVLTLALWPTGRVIQLVRGAMREEKKRPYVLAAEAMGHRRRRVVMQTFKNVVIGVITYVGYDFARFLAGAEVVVEALFNWPGLGQLGLVAIQRRDLPLAQGVVLVIAVLVATINLLLDLLYAWIDPRIRYN